MIYFIIAWVLCGIICGCAVLYHIFKTSNEITILDLFVFLVICFAGFVSSLIIIAEFLYLYGDKIVIYKNKEVKTKPINPLV